MAISDKSVSRARHVGFVVLGLKQVIASGIHNLDSKQAAKSLDILIRKLGADGAAACGDQLWNEANQILMHLRGLGYFDEGVLVSAIPRPPAMTRPKEKVQKPPPVLTDAKPTPSPQSRSKKKKNRKGRKSRKPLLIFSGGFETSRRRH
jgi:hypothetical protein